MLHKCANPSCDNQFRHLSEGKLFQVETEYFENGVRGQANGGARSRSRRRVEYFWLCAECAMFLNLTFDKTHGVVTVPAAEAQYRKTMTKIEAGEFAGVEPPLAVGHNHS